MKLLESIFWFLSAFEKRYTEEKLERFMQRPYGFLFTVEQTLRDELKKGHPLYDAYFQFGITEQKDMVHLTADLFYIYIKDRRADK